MHWNCSVIQRRQQLPQTEKESGVDMDHAWRRKRKGQAAWLPSGS
jgi:hypothetical protein